jgi:membrane associated rhomboid family serine protease
MKYIKIGKISQKFAGFALLEHRGTGKRGVKKSNTEKNTCNSCTIDELSYDSYVSFMKYTMLNRKFRYSYTNVALKLIIANAVIFFLTQLMPQLYAYLAMVPVYTIYRYWYWQVFTYMFVHADFTHILFNMFGLFMFGMPVERRIGSKEFLLFYLLTGTLSGIFSLLSYYLSGTNVILVGASGAIYAVLFAFAVLYPSARIFVFGILPIRAPVLVVLYTLLEVFNQVGGSTRGVAHLTHLAGFGFAFLYFIIRMRINPIDEWRRNR